MPERWSLAVLASAALVAGGPDLAASNLKPPPGCMLASRTYTNTTPAAIPATAPPTVVTSTIEVGGLRGKVLDVEVDTFLRHTWNADLDVTLTSPSGRVVTLTTDNGGGNQNVFDGTHWTDRADAVGVAASGVVDHLYSDLTTATPLLPEEGFAAFLGDSPAGTWTLTISDDTAGNGGTLDSWSLTVRTIGNYTTAGGGYIHNPALPIPAFGTVSTTHVFPATYFQPAYIESARVTTTIHHPSPGDLRLTLTSAAGTIVNVTSNNGGNAVDAFAGTLFRDTANPLGQVPYDTNDGVVTDQVYVSGAAVYSVTPEEPLSALVGENPEGTWTLTVTNEGGSTGTLDSWMPSYTQIIECFGPGGFNSSSMDGLLLRNSVTNEHVMWHMNGQTRIGQTTVSPALGPTQQAVGTADFVGDFDTDLVVYDTAGGQVEFWAMAFGTRVGDAVPLTGGGPLALNWKLAATGDFNHDGLADIVWRNTTSQNVVIWTLGEGTAPSNQKTGAIIPVPSRAVDANWEIVAALDLDHDNNRDFLWYNTTSGNIVVWFMDASVHRITGSFTNPANAGASNWRVLAGGDYGIGPVGDRRTDIVWRNDTSGKYVVWYMDGGFPTLSRLSGEFTIPAAPSPNPTDWTIVGPR